MQAYTKKVLLLSSPRSGSTLLANILRSHPRFEYYNELFTRAPYLLPNFEQAFQASVPDLQAHFENDFALLKKYKLSKGRNFVHRQRIVKFALFLVIKLMASMGGRLSFIDTQWNYFHKSYHINSLHEPPIIPFWLTQFRKEAQTADYLRALTTYRGSQKHGRSTFLNHDKKHAGAQPTLTKTQRNNLQAVVEHSHLMSLWS